VFVSIEIFVSFAFVWNVCVVARRKMIVWQGSCQMKCTWRKSRNATVEG
jgi:hypothetical protein